jgi:DNA-binding PadR family transcriptional regulator
MDHSDALPIALLYTQGRDGIEGATRFQKLAFLAQQEGDVEEIYEFSAAQFGPYSYELDQALHTLEAEGLVEVDVRTNRYGDEKYVYSLTVEGIQRARELVGDTDTESLFGIIHELKGKYNDWGLERLLRYVYDRYEEYATETELDTDRLFDPEAESVFAERQETTAEDGRELRYRHYISNADVSQNVDDTWTARDLDHELTAMGDTRTEALNNLGEVIAATEGEAGHEPTDEELEELGIDPEQARSSEVEEVPDFMI